MTASPMNFYVLRGLAPPPDRMGACHCELSLHLDIRGRSKLDVNALAQKAATDPALVQRIKEDPVRELSTIASTEPAYRKDVWTYRLVVIMLGTVAIGVVVGAIVLFALNKGDLPSGVIALGSAAVGALAGLLAPSPGHGTG
jgi:hypothetical protein